MINNDFKFFFSKSVNCRFKDLYVDVDFAQFLSVDCRQTYKIVVESTETQTPPAPTPCYIIEADKAVWLRVFFQKKLTNMLDNNADKTVLF